MRCREQSKVPTCFRGVKCPYPQAQTAFGRWGAINYSFVGPPDGEVVVCFHGLNGSRLLFNDMSEYISKAGEFRVLSFDLYGHGLSNAPKVDLCPFRGSCSRFFPCGSCPRRGRYDLDFFVDQTDDLLTLLGLAEVPVNLIGFSLGGTIALAFASRFPAKVKRIVAISPAGFIPKVQPSYYLLKACWLCVIPLAPHFICTCCYKRDRFARSMRNEDPDVDDDVIDSLWCRFVWQLYVKRGVASATLATCHRIPLFNARNLFRDAGEHPRPVLLIWGEQDSLNPPHTVGETVKQCFSNVQMMVVKQAGHIAICDQPRQVVLSILDFLRQPPDANMREVKIVVPPMQLKRPPPMATMSAVPPRPDEPVPAPPRDGQADAPAPPTDGVVAASATAADAAEAGANEQRANVASFLCLDRRDDNRAERVAQMPVPVILGHREEDGVRSTPENAVADVTAAKASSPAWVPAPPAVPLDAEPGQARCPPEPLAAMGPEASAAAGGASGPLIASPAEGLSAAAGPPAQAAADATDLARRKLRLEAAV